MADEADQEPEARAPWTIKGVHLSTRKAATDAANHAGLTVAEWLQRAVHTQVDRDRKDAVIPPGKPDRHNGQTGRALALAGDDDRPAVALNLTGLADALRAAVETAQAADELPGLRGLARDATGLLRDQLRAARGLAPIGRRRERHEDDAAGLTS